MDLTRSPRAPRVTAQRRAPTAALHPLLTRSHAIRKCRLGPVAVRALKKVLDTPSHRDFGRAIGLVIERVSPQQSTHTLKVDLEAGPGLRATADVLARIAELASRAGIDTSKMPPLIDAKPIGKAEQAA
jgi:hypothetical protein